MAQAMQGNTVKVHYTGKLADGTVFDTSANRDPLQFKLGAGQIIPGFEQAVAVMNVGEAKTIKIPAEQAYGHRRQEMVAVIDRRQLPAEFKPAIGQRLQLNNPQGRAMVVSVTGMTETNRDPGRQPSPGRKRADI